MGQFYCEYGFANISLKRLLKVSCLVWLFLNEYIVWFIDLYFKVSIILKKRIHGNVENWAFFNIYLKTVNSRTAKLIVL